MRLMSDMEPNLDRPTRGRTIELIRWLRHPDGWKPDTIDGTYLRYDPRHWVIEVDGQAQHLSRTAWARYTTHTD
jgi:hypothetical protein